MYSSSGHNACAARTRTTAARDDARRVGARADFICAVFESVRDVMVNMVTTRAGVCGQDKSKERRLSTSKRRAATRF
jgi:hypothetical protein